MKAYCRLIKNDPQYKEVMYRAYQLLSKGQEYKLTAEDIDALIEISFKAGTREVVEWVNKNVHLYLRDDNSFVEELHAKLKEWEIEEKSKPSPVVICIQYGWLPSIWAPLPEYGTDSKFEGEL